jgi:hypothetical protein
MDPYLEDSEHWRSFHHLLPDEIMAELNAVLSAKYYADVEVQTRLEEVGIATVATVCPDAAVLEVDPLGVAPVAVAVAPAAPIQRVALPAEEINLRTVQVYVTETKRLVTSIEILSPVNKRGEELEAYRQKRTRILRSPVHLIELDLLRSGQRPGWEVNHPPLDTEYVVLVNRAGEGVRISEIWPVAINEPLPLLPVPLLAPDPDVVLDLGHIVRSVYARGVYERRIDYARPVPPPPLRAAMGAWWTERQPA